MMKYPNVLGKDFKRKEDAYGRFQECRDEMVRTLQLGPSHVLTEETPVKKSWMDQLFKDYFVCQDPDWYKRKIGLGVKDWFFARDSEGGICLWIIQKQKEKPKHDKENCLYCRKGGVCLSQLSYDPPVEVPVAAKWMFTCFGTGIIMNENPLYRVKQAMRKAVKYQIKKFRDSVKDECQECGEEEYGLGLQVDHTPNFVEIANNFMKKYDKEYLIKNVSKGISQDIWYFINDKLENEWCEFHLKESTLRLLCKPCHDKKTYKRKAA